MKNKLTKTLKKYSAAAIALVAASATTEGQVVYNQVNKTLNSSNPTDSVDINMDGNYDFLMTVTNFVSTTSSYTYTFDRIMGKPMNFQGHALAGTTSSSSYAYPFKLNSGDPIKSQMFLPPNDDGTFVYLYSGSPYGSGQNWNGGVVDGFLGMKLQIGANVHYGWIRMDISADAHTVVIKDMAYQVTPNGGISAGEQGLDFPEYAQIANSVWIAGNQLHTELLSDFANATVYIIDIAGKIVQTCQLNGGINTFDLVEMPAGTYVISLQMDGKTFNKKAVVH